jgi:serine protease Do
MRHRFPPATLFGLALAGVMLLPAPPRAAAQQMSMQMMTADQAALIRNLLPTVVNITSFVNESSSTAGMNASSGSANPVPNRPKTLQGSGLFIDASGVILTNDHVIDGAYDIHVTLSDGTHVPGRVLATAARIDLALVKVDTEHPITVVRWADSDKVQIADPVFAIGNPLGIGLSVSAGIISALNRNIMDTPYDDFIQTDAAINHGNSGGPLFNRAGEVIGVDTAIISPTTGSVGLGFAIPANDARYVANRLLHDGSIRSAYLGIKIEEVTQEMAEALGMRQPAGSIVAMVREGDPAAMAGLQVGDVILRYGNQSPPDERAMLRAFARSAIGQPVPVTVLRAGSEQALKVTPVAWPQTETASASGSTQAASPAMLVPPNLGLSLGTLTPDRRAHYGLQMGQNGVLIDGVTAGTDAFDRGLVPGDVILRVQGTDVGEPQQIQAAIDTARSQHKTFILALVLPKVQQIPGPRWTVLRVSAP